MHEVFDPVRLKQLAIKNLKYNEMAMPDPYRPCQRVCRICEPCSRAFSHTEGVFRHPDVPVFEVEDGVIFFTRENILHGFFTDGSLLGKWPDIERALERRSLATGRDRFECWVPRSSRTVARWLCRHGFERQSVRSGGFPRDGKDHPVEVLTWDS